MMARAVTMQRCGMSGSTIRSCTLAFGVSSRSSECLGRINMRSFLSSLLVIVGKGLKLTRNRSISHGFGSAEQSLCCF
jgi:hypothetical protein